MSMPGNRRSAHRQSTVIAYGSMAAALSVVILLSGGLIPVMTYVSPLLAGLILLPVLAEFGKRAAWTCYLASALLVVLLGVDKEAAFFYLFFGYYPIVKWQLDRIRRRGLCLLVKVLLFSLSAGLMYALLAYVLGMEALLKEFGEMGAAMTAVFFALLVICMLVYDRLLFPMLLIYDRRLKPRLRLK